MNLIPWKGKRQNDDTTELMRTSPMSFFRSEMDRLFDRFFGDDRGLTRPDAFGDTGWVPSLDVSETDTEVSVRAEVPGVDPKDLDISVSGQMLTISGEKKESRESKGESYHQVERRFGSFRRSVQLPASIDTERVSAEHKDGVVMIRLQKRPGAVPKRIPVTSKAK